MTEAVVETRGISKNYGRFAAVADMSLSVGRGEVYALVGQNGAGKTTLLKMICGLTPPSCGELRLFGRSGGRELGAARSRTGAMIETPGFLPYLTAAENLEYCRIQRGGRDRAAVGRALELTGLSGAGKKPFRKFSLGMKQRLGLALAVMGSPQLLLLDEPINGLDPMGIKEFRDIITNLNREDGVTVVISSHILGELSQIATVYGFIDRGRLVESMTAEELESKCRSCLRIETDDPAKAAEVLKDRLGCGKFSVGGGALFIDERIDEPETFVRALVENGVGIRRVGLSGISLEQYFIKLVGGMGNA